MIYFESRNKRESLNGGRQGQIFFARLIGNSISETDMRVKRLDFDLITIPIAREILKKKKVGIRDLGFYFDFG